MLRHERFKVNEKVKQSLQSGVGFSEKLRKLMSERKLTKNRLAKRIGISHVAVGNYLDRGRIPATKQLEAIAAFFGVSTDFLLSCDARFQDRQIQSDGLRLHDAPGLSVDISEILRQVEDIKSRVQKLEDLLRKNINERT